jgi:acetoacetyl-CoA synthetase
MSERGPILFLPNQTAIEQSQLTAFARSAAGDREFATGDYRTLHQWSIEHLADFWLQLAAFFGVHFHERGGQVLPDAAMPGARWFPGYRLNYAEHALRHSTGTAIVYRAEGGVRREMSYESLQADVFRARAGLRALGVAPGDTVCGYLGNSPEAVIAFLATASLGAVWSSCPPEFGAESVLDRFAQIAPKVLVATDAYDHGGKQLDRSLELERIQRGLPGLQATVLVARGHCRTADLTFQQLLDRAPEPGFESVPFDHPLWILYSSGTTGKPKAIVHGHGGILLEHYKVLGLHSNLGPNDRFFWFSTTGWMMWNYLVSGLLVGSTIVLYEGSPGYPDLNALWRLVDEEQLSYFGTSAPFIMACRSRGIEPGKQLSLDSLASIGSTGAPLPAEGFEWVYERVKPNVHLGSVSGGTDVCTAFLLSCPWLPVRAGELQCAALGAAVAAYDERGQRVLGHVGELVLEKPMPSMPVQFWNDPDGARLSASYFERFPGVWHHGDFVTCFADTGAVIHGRSDATLNRGGVRMGTSEFYRVVEDVAGVMDSLVVDTSALDNAGKLWLFVVLEGNAERGETVRMLKGELRQRVSPRHVPDVVCVVPEIPYTLSGKKLEVPIKRLLMGATASGVVNLGTLKNPAAVEQLLERARQVEDQAQSAPE